MKILIVENSLTERAFVETTLAEEGCELVVAESGEQALSFIDDYSIDIIIMDAELPGINGLEVASKYRVAEGDGDWVPIIFLSGKADGKYFLEGIEAGGDAFLTKPINPESLKAQIKAMGRIARMRQKLHSTSDELGKIMEAAVDGIITINEEGIIESVNPAMAKMSGYGADELIGVNVMCLMPESFRHAHEAGLENYINTGKGSVIGSQVEVEGLRKNGERYPIELSIGEVKFAEHRIFIGILRDITERKRSEEIFKNTQKKLMEANSRLEELTIIDGLTGIANRRCFDIAMKREFGSAVRERTELSLIMCDIDFFKSYNDSFGHVSGDTCIKKVATEIFNSVRRPADVAVRYGGEEFAVILPRTELSGALFIAKNIQEAIREMNLPSATAATFAQVTVSIGVASIRPGREDQSSALIEMADQALYRAKENGRNRIEHIPT